MSPKCKKFKSFSCLAHYPYYLFRHRINRLLRRLLHRLLFDSLNCLSVSIKLYHENFPTMSFLLEFWARSWAQILINYLR